MITPEVIEHKVLYRGYFDVHVDQLLSQQGDSMAYTILDLKAHAAAILARTSEGKLVINKEYRHPTGQWLLSCPGGRIDEGESPLEAGKRELLEETGYTKGKATLMGNIFPLPAVTCQSIYYLFIDGVELNHRPTPESFEFILTELMTPEELFKQISQGAPLDGILCTALLLAKTSGIL